MVPPMSSPMAPSCGLLFIRWSCVIVKVMTVLPFLQPEIKRVKARLHGNGALLSRGSGTGFDDFQHMNVLFEAVERFALFSQSIHHLSQAIELAPADTRERALRTMAVSYAFEGKADEAAKYEKQVFDARTAKPDFNGAAEIANELARIYLESGDLDKAYQWYKAGYETALRKTDVTDADKYLWAFRWEHAQARIAARRSQRDQAQKHVLAAKAALDRPTIPSRPVSFLI